jgi:hypothetical protein
MSAVDADELVKRAAAYWRTRYAPTYLGLRRVANIAFRGSAHQVPISALARKQRAMPLATREFPIFKDFTTAGRPTYRRCIALAPWAAVAESAVLSDVLATFAQPPYVYSYKVAPASSAHVFGYFIDGFESRLRDVTRAVEECQDPRVVVGDIKSFYPSVSPDLVRRAAHDLSRKLARGAAEAFLDQFIALASDGLPVGPATSHVIANLVLRNFDEAMAALHPGRYFRYVDDIIIVCEGSISRQVEDELRSRLSDLSLELKSDKSAILTGDEWLGAEPTLQDATIWRGENVTFQSYLSAGEACLLSGNPEQQLEAALVARGVPSTALLRRRAGGEAPSLGERLTAVLQRARGRNSSADVADLAATLRAAYGARVERLCASREGHPLLSRWRLQRCVRMMGRLALLMPMDDLVSLSEKLPDVDASRPMRDLVRALSEGRPGLMLPYTGGSVRQLCFVWTANGKPPAHAAVSVRTQEYFESAIELVAGGALAPDAVESGHLEGRRLAEALLGTAARRAEPDFSFEDEVQSLFLNVPVRQRFPVDPTAVGDDENVS